MSDNVADKMPLPLSSYGCRSCGAFVWALEVEAFKLVSFQRCSVGCVCVCRLSCSVLRQRGGEYRVVR